MYFSDRRGTKEELIDEWHFLYPTDPTIQAGQLPDLLAVERELHTRALLGLFTGTTPPALLDRPSIANLARSLHVPPSQSESHRCLPRHHQRRHTILVPTSNVGRNHRHRIHFPHNVAPSLPQGRRYLPNIRGSRHARWL